MSRAKRDQSAAVDVNELDAVRRVFGHLATLHGDHSLDPQMLLRTWEGRTIGALHEHRTASAIAYALHYMKRAVKALEAFGVHEPDVDQLSHGWSTVRLAVDVDHPKALALVASMFAVLGLDAISLPRCTLRNRDAFVFGMTPAAASKVLLGLQDDDPEELSVNVDFSEVEAAVAAGRPAAGNDDTITVLITKIGSALHWSERTKP